MKVGYARVSNENQNLDAQIEELQAAGCETIFQENISAVTTIKPELENALLLLTAGDTLVVCKLDRLGRRTIELVSFLESLKNRDIGFHSLMDGIDSSNGAIGDAYGIILNGFSELERDLARGRARRGFEVTRASKKRSGPKEKVPDDNIKKGIQLLMTTDKDGQPRTGSAVAKTIGLSRSSFYRRIKKLKADEQE
ncbi:MAG: recombinase family protein [Sneathiella sp.]